MPPIVAGALHGRGARIVLEGGDFSCRLRDLDLQLGNEAVDITALCNGMKQWIPSIPDGKLSLGGFYDAGTRGTHKTWMGRLARGQTVQFAIQPQGHEVGGIAMMGAGLITQATMNHTVTDVISAGFELQLGGDLWIGRTLVPIITPTVPSVGAGWAMVQVDRQTLMPDQYALAPYTGLLYFQFRNDQATSRTLKLYSHSSPMVAGAAPAGATSHGTVTVPSGSVVAGAFGTLSDPLAVGRYVAAFIENNLAAEATSLYIGLVDLELSIIQTQWAIPEAPGQLGWLDFNATYWDNGAPMLYAAAP